MESPQYDFVTDLLHTVEHLSQEKKIRALESCFNSALIMMDTAAVIAIRKQLCASVEKEPELGTILDLIDGHIALWALGSRS